MWSNRICQKISESTVVPLEKTPATGGNGDFYGFLVKEWWKKNCRMYPQNGPDPVSRSKPHDPRGFTQHHPPKTGGALYMLWQAECVEPWGPWKPAHVSWIWIVMGSTMALMQFFPFPTCGIMWTYLKRNDGTIHGFRAILWKYTIKKNQHQLGSGPDVATSAWAMLEISNGPRHWWFHDLAIGENAACSGCPLPPLITRGERCCFLGRPLLVYSENHPISTTESHCDSSLDQDEWDEWFNVSWWSTLTSSQLHD